MQDAITIEREAARRVPGILAELLDEHAGLETLSEPRGASAVADFAAVDARGRQWIFEVKSSSRAGQIDRAAAQLAHFADGRSIPVLVVPFMSAKGAEVADRAGLNWMDLSGNAHIRGENLHIWVQGRPNEMRSPGRPSSPFAPKSARISRTLLLDPSRWWRQKDLADATGLDDGNVSRIVRRLDDELLLERRGPLLRPHDPDLLLDAWAQDYRYDRHDVVSGHISGSGIEMARKLANRLGENRVRHAFTGLPAAWAIDHFARFRLTTVYIDEDPRRVADLLEMRQAAKGANVHLVGPDDAGVFDGSSDADGLHCVAPVQVYLDLLHLPERAGDAARHMREHHLDWHARAT
jgi:transcriptional regulator with AbiEi antitoxin domain of type IV toxin-antitoxin system